MTLDDVKVGDLVILNYGYGNERMVCTVESVQKLHIVVKGVKYRKHSGTRAGEHNYGSSRISVGTPELIAKVTEETKRKRLLAQLEQFRYKDLSTAHLEEILELCQRETSQ
jgi:hypothetical protein